MVVAHTQPSSSKSERPRKTRRSLKKKKAPRIGTEEGDTLAQPDDGDELMIETGPTFNPQPSGVPEFPPLSASAQKGTLKSEARRVPIPPHRMSPIKKDWLNIFGPLTEVLGLQVRMNLQRRCVDIRVSTVQKFLGRKIYEFAT
jgi:hypothetical protein